MRIASAPAGLKEFLPLVASFVGDDSSRGKKLLDPRFAAALGRLGGKAFPPRFTRPESHCSNAALRRVDSHLFCRLEFASFAHFGEPKMPTDVFIIFHARHGPKSVANLAELSVANSGEP